MDSGLGADPPAPVISHYLITAVLGKGSVCNAGSSRGPFDPGIGHRGLSSSGYIMTSSLGRQNTLPCMLNDVGGH